MGLQNRGRFKMGIFRILPGARANLTRTGRAGVSRLLLHLGSLLKMALRLRCGGFSRLFGFFFVRARFRKLQVVLFTPASFCLRVFPIFSSFFLGFGSTQPCTGIFGHLAVNPPYFSVFCCLFTKTLFLPLKNGLFWFIPQCLPFFFPGFFHFSLSLSLSLFFYSLLSCLSFSFLFCYFLSFLRFCFMKGTTSKYHI